MRRELFIGLLLAAATALVYGQVADFDFTSFDDGPIIFENPNVRGGLTLHGVLWALSTSYFDFWHPLTWWSHMLDCTLFGLDPGSHHLVNLGFHVANTLLLFGVLRQITGAWKRSAMVAALFALHPLHVESVAWLSERKDVLSAFFFMLTLWAYARYARRVTGDTWQVTRTEAAAAAPDSSRVTRHASLFYGLALVFFALGLMSKPMLVTLPFVLLLLDYWPLRRVAGDGWRVPGNQNPIAQLPDAITGRVETERRRERSEGGSTIYCLRSGRFSGWRRCHAPLPTLACKAGNTSVPRNRPPGASAWPMCRCLMRAISTSWSGRRIWPRCIPCLPIGGFGRWEARLCFSC